MDGNTVPAHCLNSAPKNILVCLFSVLFARKFLLYHYFFFQAGTFNNEIIPVTIPQKKGMIAFYIEHMHWSVQHSCKFIGTKCLHKKRVELHRIGLVQQRDKRKSLHKKTVQLPQDWFVTTTWPPIHCFGTPIWLPWRHVNTFHRPRSQALSPLPPWSTKWGRGERAWGRGRRSIPLKSFPTHLNH